MLWLWCLPLVRGRMLVGLGAALLFHKIICCAVVFVAALFWDRDAWLARSSFWEDVLCCCVSVCSGMGRGVWFLFFRDLWVWLVLGAVAFGLWCLG